MVLVDTSIWVTHFRSGSMELVKLLRSGQVLCHPAVIGELALGTLRNRQEILQLLSSLPQPRLATDREVIYVVEEHKLYGEGIGWVDAQLVASSYLSKCQLWTSDRRLRDIALVLGLD